MLKENQVQSSSSFSSALSQNGLTAPCGHGGQTPIVTVVGNNKKKKNPIGLKLRVSNKLFLLHYETNLDMQPEIDLCFI